MLAASASVATATFALADALLWRALPFGDAQQLAMLVTTHANGEQAVSLPDFTILRDQTRQARVAAASTLNPEYALSGFGGWGPAGRRSSPITSGLICSDAAPAFSERHSS